MIVDEPKVLVKTAETTDLSAFTTLRLEYLPAVIPVAAPKDVADETTFADPAVPVVESVVVSDLDEQQLLYHWLLYGPPWTPDTVMQAPPYVEDPSINPLLPAPPRRVINHYYDGVRRMLRPRP